MRYFSPAFIGGTLLAIVAVGAALGMGIWQIDVWQAERAAEAVDLTRDEPVELTEVMGPDDPFPAAHVGQPVTLSGTWLDDSYWVAGRDNDGVEGYWAMTPFSVGEPGAPAILVARGWSESTDVDPDGAVPTGAATLTGWLQPAEGSMEVDEDPADDVYPEVRVADAVQRLEQGQDLYTGYVALHAEQLEQLPEAPKSTGLQNALYALEWFLFGAFASYIYGRWIADQRIAARKARDEAGDGPDDGPDDDEAAVSGDREDGLASEARHAADEAGPLESTR